MRPDTRGDGADQGSRQASRRSLLCIGSLGALGLTLPGLLRAESERTASEKVGGRRAAPKSTIQSCMLILYDGGPSHLDTWDIKPSAPREVRGLFGSIATSVPGLRVSEHMPRAARVMDRLAILRGMHHPMTNHTVAAFMALCGRNSLKGDQELLGNDRNDLPCGSILKRELARSAPTAHFCRLATRDVQRRPASRPVRRPRHSEPAMVNHHGAGRRERGTSATRPAGALADGPRTARQPGTEADLTSCAPPRAGTPPAQPGTLSGSTRRPRPDCPAAGRLSAKLPDHRGSRFLANPA